MNLHLLVLHSSWCSVNTYTNIIMKSLLVFAFILSLNYVTARPQAAGETPEITKETKICEEPRDGDSFSLCHFYNWFTDLSNLIRTTGDVVEMGGDMEPSLKGVSKHFDDAADYLDDYHEEGVRSGYDWVKGPLVDMVEEMFDTNTKDKKE